MTINKYTAVLVKDKTIQYKTEPATDPEAVRGILCKLFHADRLPTERLWQICTNTKMNAVGVFELATGTVDMCVVDIPSIVRNAVLTGARGVILAHNHPSGEGDPSRDDIELTRRVKQGLGLMDIELMDHVIVLPYGYYSFKERGLL